ncbi:Peptidase M28 [Phaffia rhodozyma]|uniref:Peptide hydrolase n=1 Tax=Phaffia rhodozyma TaxID=264483 RepID=A0A0F7SQF6_PHARH|nr:Peptidase M28 [Phaffia rhodozyma]
MVPILASILALSVPVLVISIPMSSRDDKLRHTIVTNPSPAFISAHGSNYYGTYGSAESSTPIYIVSQSESGRLKDNFGGVSVSYDEGQRLFWIGQAGLAEDFDEGKSPMKFAENVNEILDLSGSALSALWSSTYLAGQDHQIQAAFGNPTPRDEAVGLIHLDPKEFAVVQVGKKVIPYLDVLLPRGLVAVALPENPLPLMANKVNDERIEFLRNATKHVKHDSKIDKIVSSLTISEFKSAVQYLTGENSSSPITSRHSFSDGAKLAAKWIASEVEETGASCSTHDFLPGFAPNVLCEYPVHGGKKPKNGQIILSGHYDSRGTFGSLRMPGADDDASGTSQLIGIAKAIKRAGIKSFEEKVTFAFFAGEEQGLLGSAALAKQLYMQNATILLQVQADMLAYHDPDEPLQLGFPDSIGLPEAAELLTKISGIYSPELVVGVTKACCSDHQSFVEYGFPATQVFERNGPIIDPTYHNSGDLSERVGYDFNQLRSIAKVTFATLLEIGGYVV